MTGQTSKTKCTLAIERLKRGSNTDYAKLSSTTKLYVDNEFTPDASSILWPDYVSPKVMGELGRYANATWKRVQHIVKDKKCLLKFFGQQGITPSDIQQGVLGDCWLLAGLATLAARDDRLSKIFANKDPRYPPDGLIGVKVRVLNKPMLVTIDDFIPVISTKNGYAHIFARPSTDEDNWACLAEKAVAKMFGNYGQLVAGDTQEIWRMLTGAPTAVYKVKDYVNKTEELFNLLQGTFKKGFLHMGHLNDPKFNLEEGHAFSIMGVHELLDPQKAVAYRLIRINNPHGVEGKYNGDWADNDPKWTPNFKAQVPEYVNADDGQFFMDLNQFIDTFEVFMVNYVRDDWKINTHSVRGDDGKPKTYFFKNTRIQDIYIGLDVYPDRFYPYGCKPNTTSIQMMILRECEVLYNYKFSSRQGYGWIKFEDLIPGNYSIIVIFDW